MSQVDDAAGMTGDLQRSRCARPGQRAELMGDHPRYVLSYGTSSATTSPWMAGLTGGGCGAQRPPCCAAASICSVWLDGRDPAGVGLLLGLGTQRGDLPGRAVLLGLRLFTGQREDSSALISARSLGARGQRALARPNVRRLDAMCTHGWSLAASRPAPHRRAIRGTAHPRRRTHAITSPFLLKATRYDLSYLLHYIIRSPLSSRRHAGGPAGRQPGQARTATAPSARGREGR